MPSNSANIALLREAVRNLTDILEGYDDSNRIINATRKMRSQVASAAGDHSQSSTLLRHIDNGSASTAIGFANLIIAELEFTASKMSPH